MRCNQTQPSTLTDQARSLSYTLTRFCQGIRKNARTATLVVSLGLGGGFWFATETLVPQIAQAESARVNLSLDRLPNETYESLERRAEMAATAAVQKSFAQENQVTDVAVTILGENQGAIAPIISLQVSQPQWRSYPNIQRWATHYHSAKALLLFDVATTPTTDTSNSVGHNYPTQLRGTVNPYNNPRRFNRFGAQQGNNNSINGRQRAFSTPVQPGNNSFTPIQPFTQPGNNSFTPIQPVTQPGIVNSTPSSSISPAPGSGMTPLPPTTAPESAPSNTQNLGVPSSTSTPANVPLTPLTPLPNNGTTANTTPGT